VVDRILRFRLGENLDRPREVEGSVRPDIGRPPRRCAGSPRRWSPTRQVRLPDPLRHQNLL